MILGGLWGLWMADGGGAGGGGELSREQLEDLAAELDAPDPESGEWGEGEVHERFSYPERACAGEGTGGGRLGQVIHQCDLPTDHVSRHMCGRCGLYFTARGGS